MYPFLHEVVDRLRAAIAGEQPALTVFSGHDTVVAPVLSALGVYGGHLCRWPPYASRIVFELYQSTPLPVAVTAHGTAANLNLQSVASLNLRLMDTE